MAILAINLSSGCTFKVLNNVIDNANDYCQQKKELFEKDSMKIPPNVISGVSNIQVLPKKNENLSLILSKNRTLISRGIKESNIALAVMDAKLEGKGEQHWLLVRNVSRLKLWKLLRSFWKDQGFSLVEDSFDLGIMETESKESSSPCDQILISDILSKALFNTSSYIKTNRNRYRTRVDSDPKRGIYVFITHYYMREIPIDRSNKNQWKEKSYDPELEIEYLQRLFQMLKKSEYIDYQQNIFHEKLFSLKTMDNIQKDIAKITKIIFSISKDKKSDVINHRLMLSGGYEQIWQRVGNALKYGNFTIEESDKTKGIYFIRYGDPKNSKQQKKNFWDKLLLNKRGKIIQPIRYGVLIDEISPSEVRIVIINNDGQKDNSPQANHILDLIFRNIR